MRLQLKMRNRNIQNLRTEKEGIQILRNLEPRFVTLEKIEKRRLFSLCGIDFKRFYNAVDGAIINCPIDSIRTKDDFLFVEIKTTRSKNVTELPFGVFFGITENEEHLFSSCTNYRLCIVHTDLKAHILIDFQRYQQLIQNKRVQYQINFKSKKAFCS